MLQSQRPLNNDATLLNVTTSRLAANSQTESISQRSTRVLCSLQIYRFIRLYNID